MNSSKLVSLLLGSLAVASVSAQIVPFTVDAGNDGFTGWSVGHTSATGSENGNFLGGSAPAAMETSGTAGTDVTWGLYANSGQTASLTYDFGGVLPVGGTVSIDISLGFIDSGGTVGIGLQNSSGVNRFESYYIGGSTDSFKINDDGGQEDVTGPTADFTSASWNPNDNFQTIVFTQEASDSYSVTFNGTSITNSGLTLTDSDISQLRIFNFNSGPGTSGSNDQFFNNLTVVPEPANATFLVGGMLSLLMVLRRRA